MNKGISRADHGLLGFVNSWEASGLTGMQNVKKKK
jgi:hypothetical protein